MAKDEIHKNHILYEISTKFSQIVYLLNTEILAYQ